MSPFPCLPARRTAARARPCVSALLVGFLAAGCAGLCPCAPSRLRGASNSALLDEWLAQHPIGPDQELAAAELHRTPEAGLHVVQVRNSEPMHLHAAHDLKVMLCRGKGMLYLGPRMVPMKPGDVIPIPRNTPHAFVNTALEPAVLFLVITPPLDGTDRVLIQ